MQFYPALLASNGSPEHPTPGTAIDGSAVVPSLAGKTAIVVEDEGVTQLQVRMALTQAGMKVVGVAGSGQEGVELALKTRPKLVVMDVKMPGKIDGLEATRQILAEFDTCVVMLTAYHDLAHNAEEAGACGFVVKPVTFLSLIPQIKIAMERHYAT